MVNMRTSILTVPEGFVIEYHAPDHNTTYHHLILMLRQGLSHAKLRETEVKMTLLLVKRLLVQEQRVPGTWWWEGRVVDMTRRATAVPMGVWL